MTRSATQRRVDMRVALCPHISVSHYRGGEKWVASFANLLAENGADVAVRALPYVPGGERRVDPRAVLDDSISYREAWRHDLTGFDVAYVFYTPLAHLLFHGSVPIVAGVHSWVYVSNRLYEPYYGAVPTLVKWLYRTVGPVDLRRFDAVHSVTPAFDSPHPNTHYVPNFVDTDRFHPNRAPLSDEFTVISTAAHIPEKGWDRVRSVAAALPDDVRVVTTGASDDPNVRGLGFLDEDELATAYARAHVVLHPARVDTDSMVINEACASGTPVVTTPLPTHVRRNEAVIHRDSTPGACEAILRLRREWRHGTGYRERCERARAEGEAHAVDAVYPRLERLLRAPTDPVGPEPSQRRVGGGSR